MFSGRVTNRCDYRRHIPADEENCDNANNNGGEYEDGCDAEFEDDQVNEPIPQSEGKCWVVNNFGNPVPDVDVEKEIHEFAKSDRLITSACNRLLGTVTGEAGEPFCDKCTFTCASHSAPDNAAPKTKPWRKAQWKCARVGTRCTFNRETGVCSPIPELKPDKVAAGAIRILAPSLVAPKE